MFYYTATPVSNKSINMYDSQSITGGMLYKYDFKNAIEDSNNSQTPTICDYQPLFLFYDESLLTTQPDKYTIESL